MLKEKKIDTLLTQIETLLDVIQKKENDLKSKIIFKEIHPEYKKSIKNLVRYIGVRKYDLRTLQKKLRTIGLSSFSNAETHIRASLLQTKIILLKLKGSTNELHDDNSEYDIEHRKKRLKRHTKLLFGPSPKERRVRIMVTQPSEAAENYKMVYDMVLNGMNIARINCAHDDEVVWHKIIENVKKASAALDKNVKIAMDLAGPKIRTGSLIPGPKVKKFKPQRDKLGTVIHPAVIKLTYKTTPNLPDEVLTVSKNWFDGLRVGDVLSLKDARNKKRHLSVVVKTDEFAVLNLNNTCYVTTKTKLKNLSNKELGSTRIGELPPTEEYITLKTDDILTITKKDIPGEPAKFDTEGNVICQAHISCQFPEIFDYIKTGEKILFDDGKIEGVIKNMTDESFDVKIIRALEKGSKLRAEKGINLPGTNLKIEILNNKDKKDLKFVAKYADIVNFSFVNSVDNVDDLLNELRELNVLNQINIILKIETRTAFSNLADILLTAMKTKYIGVMIARGDLAIETGWDAIGKVQEEILSLCAAAHVPVVWATQVLENFAKKGLPSRSEITDATNSLRAECVMLNKGPYINDVLHLLNTILAEMEQFHEKNEIMLPKLKRI